MKKSTCILLVLLLVTTLLPLSAVDTAHSQDLVKVRFGVSPFQDTLLPILGAEFDWYEEQGLDVEFVILGWTEVQEALAAGEIDVAINNISSVIAVHQQWPDFVYYYGFNIFDQGAALMAKPEYKSTEEFEAEGLSHEEAVQAALEQMSGKTVVTTGNTDMEQAVLGAAIRADMDYENNLNIVDLNPDEGLAAFLTGTGDFFLGGLAQRFRATQEGMKAIVVGPDLAPPPINGIVTTRTYAEENPEVMLKLIHVWFQIVNYIEENTDEGAEIILDVLNTQTGATMGVDDFKEYWQNWEHYPLTPAEIERDILDPEGYGYWKARWDDCNWYFYEVKQSIEEPVDSDEAFMMVEAHEAYMEMFGDQW